MYTREQTLALINDRNMTVSANAGSGKTKVLVDKYIKILINENEEFALHPRKVVAITFTKKAASEMKSRVVHQIDKMMSENDKKSPLYKKLRFIKDNLHAAKIMTIHSFAVSILRDYPIESNVQPNFSEISLSESLMVIDICYQRVINQKLSDENEKQKNQLLTIMSKYEKRFEEIIKSLVSNQEKYLNMANFYGSNPNEIYKRILSIYKEDITLLIIKTIKSIDDINYQINNSLLFDDIARSNFNIFHTKYLKNRDSYFTDVQLFINDIKDLKELKHGRSFLTNFYSKIFNPSFKVFIDKILESFKPELISDILHLNYINESTVFYEIAGEIIKLVDEIKTEKGLVDFDDMLIKVWSLTQDKEIAESIAMDYKVIMVDEFQDTNQIQYDIIKSIIPRLNDYQNEIDTKLFLVGDSKQSIYAFRSADVQVFMKAIDDIKLLNENLIKSGNLGREINSEATLEENLGYINLNATFRMQPALAAFINYVCDNSEKQLNNYEVAYEPLTVGRDSKQILDENQEDLINNSNGDLGTVTFLLCPANQKNNSEKNTNQIEVFDADNEENQDENYFEENGSDQLSLSDMIAKHILNCMDKQNPLFINDNGIKRIVDFKDFAILSRSRSGFKAIAEKFTEYNIPYTIHSGDGFYNSQEIIDIISYLKFLNNNFDNVALAGLLKSPFFGLNDTIILNIIATQKDGSLWEKIALYIENQITDSKFNPIKNAYDILNKTINFVNKLNISQLIYRLIEFTGWQGTIYIYKSHKQMKANVEKFINLAYDFEQRGFRNLQSFISELEILSSIDARESEAAFISGDNVVNIMTIHASKGLEFPVVLLYNTNDSNNRTKNFIFSKNFGITYKYKLDRVEANISDNDKFTLYQYKLAIKDDQLSEDAELQRLLYVALTRAKEHLIITGVFKEKELEGNETLGGIYRSIKNRSLFSLLCKEGLPLTLIDDDFEKKLLLQKKINFLNDNNIQEKTINIPIRILSSIKQFSASDYTYKISYHERNVLDLKIETEINSEIFSPTRIINFIDNEFEYFLKYEIGIDKEDIAQFNIMNDEEDTSEIHEVKGTEKGIYVHKVMENIPHWLNSDGEINEIGLEQVINEILFERKESNNNELKSMLKSISLKVSQSDLIHNYLDRFQYCMTEKNLIMPYNEHYLNGTIDFIISNKDGNYEIWDWKSNQIHDENHFKNLIKHYEFQMLFYTFMISKLYPDQEHFISRLLFTSLLETKIDGLSWEYVFKWKKSDIIEFEKYLLNYINKIVEISN